MADIASFVLDVVKCLAAPIGRQFKYLYNYNTNFENLKKEVTKLKNTRDEVQVKVTAAEKNVEEINQNIKDWQTDVEKTITEAEQLIQAKENNPRCFKGLCPNLTTRYKLSRKAVGLKRDDIDPLLQQEKEFKEVAHPTNPPEIWLRSNNKDYLAFESRTSTEKDVWDALNDKNIYMIGVYGMGGLGKTTLVKEVGRKAAEEKFFDEVVFIEVTETPSMETIQLKIAEKLGLELDKESDVAAKANKLYARLKMRKKDEKDVLSKKKDEKDEKDKRQMEILLILDNIWEELDLVELGIPSGKDRGGCKLLLTTRDRDVLDRMGSTKNFKMGTLNEEEAWNLFQKMTGDVIQTLGLHSLPQDVCKECGGLPIVICTIAKALRNKSHLFDWEDALEELRAPSSTKFEGLLENEYQKIALSYKFLRNDELKKTFLITSLMENDTSISDLFKHVVNLDVLKINNPTMEGARNRLDKVVRELKDSCLLLEGSRSKQFSMHDVIRAVAVIIAYEDHHVFTGRNDIEKEWKNKDKLKKCTKISLHDSSVISQLWPKDLDCPDLEFFYMINSSLSSFEIPEDFFKVMSKLKVLNLCNMRRLSLPSSLDILTNLQTLCLDESKIEDVAIIGNLKKLKVLSLRHSNIKSLSTTFGQLTQLRLLDLTNCGQLKYIKPNVISKLSQLEELYCKGCCIWWPSYALEELEHLSRLTSLEIDIIFNKMLPKDFFFKELKRCKISVGDCWSSPYGIINNEWLNSYEFLRMLEFQYDSTISLEKLQNFKNVELLRLAELSDDDNNLTPLFNEKVIFSHLMALELKVTSSRKIWDSQPPTFMSSLTHLTLKGCGNIKFAFPFCIAKSLQTLQHLEIRDCKDLEQIVAEEEEAQIVAEEEEAKTVGNSAFQRVTILKFHHLPKLTTFCHGIYTWKFPKLKKLEVKECEIFTSKYLSFHENSLHISEPKSLWLENKINHDLEIFELKNGEKEIIWVSQFKALEITCDNSANIPIGLLPRFENLHELKLESNAYKELFFPNLHNLEVLDVHDCCKLMSLVSSSASFQNLKVLEVDQCNGLMKLITPSIARSLVQLREISIENCGMLIEIVENEGERYATTRTEIVFDNLKTMSLRNLGSLICFCSGNYSFSFPSLEELIIGKCFNMKIFSQGILSTPKLQKVIYEKLDEWGWEKIMEIENEGNDLGKTIQEAYKKQDTSLELKFLTFQDDNSTEICYNQHQNFFYQNLTHLILWGCGNIKYAFPSSIAKIFQQLQHLKIGDCKVLEEIVAKEVGANTVVNFVFPHVTLLKLEDLPKLTTFYPERHISEWPKLKELVLRDCPKLSSKYLSLKENNEESELNISDPKSLFLDDKINLDLEVFQLRIGDLEHGGKGIIWLSQSKALEITNDKSANISLGLLQRFENSNELKLLYCDQYKELFFPNLLNLEVLDVNYCSKLMSLVPFSASLQNLKVLRVYGCNGLLMKLITPSTARSLLQLREMSIQYCEMLIEIVENEGDTRTTEIVFDNLKELSLKDLRSLACFCSGNYSFNFPSLEDLIIGGCPNMKTFSQGILSTPKLHKVEYEMEEKDLESGRSELNTTIQAQKKKVDSIMKNWNQLILSGMDIMSIWEGEFQESFGEVKTLQLIKDEYANIPLQILHKFNNLQELILRMSSYEEIFSFGEDKEHIGALTIKVLELWGLFNLKCIWKQDSRLNLILQNLDRLEVQYCHSLATLLPSLASFKNLNTLKVNYCNGMQTLMSSSTAKSLELLKTLSIQGCEMMIEVLANEGDIEKCEIVFEKLEDLYLCNLESLTCFCSRDYTLKFPNLEILYVDECSKMKTFCKGGLSMPRLQMLNDKDCSESDNDTIMQQLQNDCSDYVKDS